MSISTSNFLVIRNGQKYKVKGSQLPNVLNDTDSLLVQRSNTQYLVKIETPHTVQSASDTTSDFSYEQYSKVVERTTRRVLTYTDFSNNGEEQADKRVPAFMFDGDPNTIYKYITSGGLLCDLVIEFPQDIPVYGNIEIKAGFHGGARDGQMLINGTVVRELAAWDDDPQIFSANFTGNLRTFSIRQKVAAGGVCTGAISYIKLDGGTLANNAPITVLTLPSGTDMSRYKVNMNIRKESSNLTATIGEVDVSNRKLKLTSTSNIGSNDKIYVDQVDGGVIEINSVQNSDLFVCTDTNNVTYKVTGQKFKALFGY